MENSEVRGEKGLLERVRSACVRRHSLAIFFTLFVGAIYVAPHLFLLSRKVTSLKAFR